MKDNFLFHKQAFSRFPASLLAILSGLMSMAILLAGCGKPPVMVYKYLLEYPAPELPRRPPVTEALKVELFSVAQAFNTPAMVYRPTIYQSEVYSYHRWRVNPGNLVTDYLLRDLRHSGLFKAIFSYDSSTKARFMLEGGVEEFQEVDEGDTWRGTIDLNIILLDTSKEEVTQKVVLQKNYSASEPLIDKTPQGLADAISRAMQKLSGMIISDVYEAAWKRQTSKDMH
jgi:cholesterol transport system auxiliary component